MYKNSVQLSDDLKIILKGCYLNYVEGEVKEARQSSASYISFCIYIDILISNFNGRNIQPNSETFTGKQSKNAWLTRKIYIYIHELATLENENGNLE